MTKMKQNKSRSLTCRVGLCPRLSPRESFGENRRNEIWALPDTRPIFPQKVKIALQV